MKTDTFRAHFWKKTKSRHWFNWDCSECGAHLKIVNGGGSPYPGRLQRSGISHNCLEERDKIVQQVMGS